MFRNSVCFVGAAVIASGVLLGAQAPSPTPQSAPGSQPATGSTPAAGTPSAAGAQSAMGAKADRTFASQAAISGMAEVELGKMAAEKGSHAQVKSFGEQMVTDHTKANDELKGIATAKSMTLPAKLDAKHEAVRARLAKLTGAEFDRAYMQAMVTGHEAVATAMKTEASRGSDPELKAFAAKTLPVVQGHHKMAQDIHKELAAAATK